jgi:hypothetical protein
MNWDQISQDVSAVVNFLAPIASAALPGAAVAISLGQKIIQGVIAEEPAALSLYSQIRSGATPTQDDLAKFAADYETAYQELNADINEKLAIAS